MLRVQQRSHSNVDLPPDLYSRLKTLIRLLFALTTNAFLSLSDGHVRATELTRLRRKRMAYRQNAGHERPAPSGEACVEEKRRSSNAILLKLMREFRLYFRWSSFSLTIFKQLTSTFAKEQCNRERPVEWDGVTYGLRQSPGQNVTVIDFYLIVSSNPLGVAEAVRRIDPFSLPQCVEQLRMSLID